MISIITRCYNRLEYTIQVVNAVRNSTYQDYEHIIIDNNSKDGTKEWFKWIFENTKWYPKVRYVYYDKNFGDWGGMINGLGYAKGEYIVQLDNDIIPCADWMESMLYVLQNTGYKVVMIHRGNTKWKLKKLSMSQKLQNGLEIAKVERAVACYMMRTELFRTISTRIRRGFTSKYEMSKLVKGQICKILNRDCMEIEANFQRDKYNPKNQNVWQKI